jgi:hypothetical protein
MIDFAEEITESFTRFRARSLSLSGSRWTQVRGLQVSIRPRYFVHQIVPLAWGGIARC